MHPVELIGSGVLLLVLIDGLFSLIDYLSS